MYVWRLYTSVFLFPSKVSFSPDFAGSGTEFFIKQGQAGLEDSGPQAGQHFLLAAWHLLWKNPRVWSAELLSTSVTHHSVSAWDFL